MKISISIPDDLLRQVEVIARQLGISKNDLQTRAIAEFLKREDDRGITERLNEVYSRVQAKLDAGLHCAQLKSLAEDPWHS